jgi:hypothetical protein
MCLPRIYICTLSGGVYRDPKDFFSKDRDFAAVIFFSFHGWSTTDYKYFETVDALDKKKKPAGYYWRTVWPAEDDEP